MNTTSQNQLATILPISDKEVGEDLKKTVNARNLHFALGVGKDFSTWIKDRIEKYGFVEDEDFVTIEDLSSPNLASSKAGYQKQEGEFSPNLGKTSKGGRPLKEYHIAMDMAKELAMVENNAQGRVVRRHFIECEKQLLAQIGGSDNAKLDELLSMYLDLRVDTNGKLLAIEEWHGRETQNLRREIQNLKTMVVRQQGTPSAPLRTANHHQERPGTPDVAGFWEDMAVEIRAGRIVVVPRFGVVGNENRIFLVSKTGFRGAESVVFFGPPVRLNPVLRLRAMRQPQRIRPKFGQTHKVCSEGRRFSGCLAFRERDVPRELLRSEDGFVIDLPVVAM
jgi:phage anti-repressor protein